MNMFKPTNANSVEEYIEQLAPQRKEIILFLHDFIQKTVPSLTPHFAYNMLGYGSFKYLDYKKQIIDWPTVALASQKNYLSLYICSIIDGQYLAEKYQDKLGKVSIGRSCIRFKKLSDLNLDTLAEILKIAADHPGLRES